MPKFRKKPVVIEASLWQKNGDHPLDYEGGRLGYEPGHGNKSHLTAEECKARDYEGNVVRRFNRPDVDGQSRCKHCSLVMQKHGWIDTLEGGHIVCPGDWVITGVAGENYSCKPDIFTATYEPVDG